MPRLYAAIETWIRKAGCAIAAVMFLFAPIAAAAGDLFVGAGGANAQLKVTSMAERKFSTVVRQQYDFSCGSAALATLLSYHYERPTTEADAFREMWRVGNQDRIRQLGFSLLEMKQYLQTIGLKADGFQISLDRLQEIGVPGIALIEVNGYRHFVVIKGITDRTILVGDPSTGLVSLPRKEFEKRWDGVILFVRSEVRLGKKYFNNLNDWRLTPASPYDRAMDVESLQSQLLNQNRPSTSGFEVSTILEGSR